MKIYVDHDAKYATSSSRIDTYVTLGITGQRYVVVQAWDSTGRVQKYPLIITVNAPAGGGGTGVIGGTTYNDIEEMSGWRMCSACAGAGGGASYSMQQGISTPSQDGRATKFNLGGSVPWSHVIFTRRMNTGAQPSNVYLEFNYYFNNPAASSAMEFSISEMVGKSWYRWDTQCSYESKVWKIWDGANAKWINLPIACNRPAAYMWNNVKFEGKRENGKTVFISITLNGQKHYVNRAVGPTWMGYEDPNVSIHFQLNGNRYQEDYSVWGDNFIVRYW
jgi:hypothetical protein